MNALKIRAVVALVGIDECEIKRACFAICDQAVERFHHLVSGKSPATAEDPVLGDLVVFAGVAEFPMRVKCATLAWHALRAALRGEGDMVSTE